MTKRFLTLSAFAAALVLTGCQDEEFGYTKEQINTQASFERHFGKIDPDQVWDFSSYNLTRLGLESNFSSLGKTRLAYNGIPDTDPISEEYAMIYPDYYEVPQELRAWIDKNLREEVYNKKRGTTNFTLKMPTDRDIVIIPIYQGQAGLNYNLCIRSEDGSFDGYIWEKSAGIQVATPLEGEGKHSEEDWTDLSGKNFKAHTVGMDVRAQPVRILGDKVTGEFSLYLDVLNLDAPWDEQNGSPSFAETFSSKKQPGSKDGQMVAVPLNGSPETFDAVSKALKAAFADATTDGKYSFENFMILGCEDSNLPRNIAGPNDPRLVGTDWDMNDLIFLVVGIKVDDVKVTKDETIKKRYMIEDLGKGYDGYDDYDFNDIVIDVTQLKHVAEDGTVTTTQTLSLKHLCGTIPWQVKVGNYTSPIFPGRNDHTNPKGYDPTKGTEDASKDIYYNLPGKLKTADGEETVNGIIDITITGWDPDANNITVTAWPGAAGEDINPGDSDWTTSQKETFLKEVDGTSYAFPENGTYPFIIACDQTQAWNDEHETIPADAIVTWKKPGYETIITPGSGGSGSGGDGDGDDEDGNDGYNSFVIPLPQPDEETGEIDLNGLDIPFTSWTDDILINPEYLQGIDNGYKIITTFEKINEDEDFLMYMKVEAPWENIGGFHLDPDQTTLELTVTPGNINLLKQYGIALKGKNVRISRIQIIPGEWEGYGVDLPWDGNKTLQWGDPLIFKPECFTNAQPGDQIRVNASDNVQLAIPYDDEWKNFGWTADGKFELNAEQLAAMKTFGLVVYADNKTITHVELCRPVYCTLTINTTGAGSGTVEGAGTFESGTTVTIKAVPADGSRFVKWSDNSIENPRSFELTEDITLTAEFELIPVYHVTVSVDAAGDGTGTVEGAGDYREGSSYTIKAIPATGSHFVKWSDGDTNAQRTISNISDDASYSALFALNEYTVTAVANNADGGEVTGGGTYKYGEKVTLKASAADGYNFVSWNDGVTDATREITVSDNVTYTAKFVAAGPVTIYSGSALIGGNNQAVELAVFNKLAAAFEDGKTKLTISYSSLGGNTTLSLKTGWYNDVVTFSLEAGSESASVVLTQANIDKWKNENGVFQIGNSGTDITITSIIME